MATARVPDPTEGDLTAETDLGDRLDYVRYLALDELLAAQRPLSASHDEMLFIVIHQATELWLKLMLHELDAARTAIGLDRLGPAAKMLARVSRIQAQLIQSWDVLSTLTPKDYLEFRHRLGPASGFQSHQYRRLEYVLGNRDDRKLAVFRHRPALLAELEAELATPSLYATAIRLLDQRGMAVPAEVLERPVEESHVEHTAVMAAWRRVYEDAGRLWDLYELAEKLVDLEDWFRQWRFRHLTTVARIIGRRRGTGGTSGVAYLERALKIELFPELWRLRTEL